MILRHRGAVVGRARVLDPALLHRAATLVYVAALVAFAMPVRSVPGQGAIGHAAAAEAWPLAEAAD